MNPGLVIKLRPAGPWRIGPDSGARNRVDAIYHSDALYSAVTSALSRLGSLEEWLDATARQSTPAVSFSSCFPFLDEIGFVVPPRTIWPPTSPGLMSGRVRWKSARFVPLGIVQAVLAGQRLDPNHWSVDGASECLVPVGRPGPFRTGIRWNAAVDRLTGATERHSTACLEFRPGAGLWTIVSFADDAARDRWQNPVKAAFRLLADSGFGGERSRGWGRSEAPEFLEGVLPDMIVPPTAAPVEEPEPVAATAEVRASADIEPLAAPAAELPPDPEPEPPAAETPLETTPEPKHGEPVPPTPEPTVTEPPVSEPEVPETPISEPPASNPPVEAVTTAAPEAPLAEAVAEPAVSTPAPEPAAESVATPAPETPVAEPVAEPEAAPSAAPEPAAESVATPAPEAAVTEPVDEPEASSAVPEVAAESVATPAPEAAVTEPVAEPEASSAVPEVAAESAVAPAAEVPSAEPVAEPVDSTPAPELAAESTATPAPDVPIAEPEVAAAAESVAATAEEPPSTPAPGPQALATVAPTPRTPIPAFWLLSLYTPAADDPVDWQRGNYTVVVRGGRVDSSGDLKKQLQMVAEGSVLAATSAPSGSATDVAPDGFAHPVFRAGFAVCIPLPEVS